MADDKKKAPQFRSKAEMDKWNSLHHKSGHSLHQIAQGKATPADIQNVDKTLSGMSKLAKSVFSDAVKAVEKEVAAVQKSNLKKTKEDQEAFEKAVGELLQSRFPALLHEIQDIIEIESLEQDDRFGKTLSSQLNAFSSFLPPKDLPTTDDVVALQEASLEQHGITDDRKWETRQKKLLDTFSDRVADVFKATILSMAMSAVSPTANAQQQSVPNVPRLSGPSSSSDIVPAVPSVARRGMAMLASPKYDDSDVIDVESRVVPSTSIKTGHTDRTPVLPRPSTPLLAGPTAAAGGSQGITVSLSKAAEEAITQAASAQTKLHEQIRDMLASATKGGGPGGGSGGVDDTNENKKADVWWRSFGKWVGDKYESVSDKLSTAKDWLGTLATGLVSILLAPKMYETLANKAKELLTWDNIKEAADKAWDDFYSTGKSVVDWVIQKLGLQPVLDNAKSVFSKISDNVTWIAKKLGYGAPTTKSHFVSRQATGGHGYEFGGPPSQRLPRAPLTAAQKADIADLNEKALTRLGLGVKRGASVAGKGIAGVASYTGTNIPTGIQAQTEAESVIYNNLRSVVSAVWEAKGPQPTRKGLGNYATTNNISTTTSVPTTTVRTTPAMTVPIAGSVPASATNIRPVPLSQNTSVVGVNSFHINSGVDDTLALMNLGVITG